jgi:F0F1-type ATP synthase delta subunit
MKTSRAHIARVVADGVLAGMFDQKDITSLAAYLLGERRTGELSSLMRDVRYEWAKRGVIEVVATSAHEVTNEIKQRIEATVRQVFPGADRIAIAFQHDTSVVGGIRLEFCDHQIDLTVAGDIRKFKTLATQGKDY